MDDNEYTTFERDPFEGMDWPLEQDQPQAVESAAAEESVTVPVGRLRGKGVWLLRSSDIDLAIEMALAIGATHVLYRSGHRGMFFVDTTRRVCERLQQAGLIPFAWFQAYCDNPDAEAALAAKSVQVGCQGVVLELGEWAAGKSVGAAALGRCVIDRGLSPEQLYYASFPNIWQHLDLPYREMSAFCQGGFMPQCFPIHERTPRTVVGKWAYGEHARWSAEWGGMPPLYPVLAAHKEEGARLGVSEFLEWVEALASYDPPFFSVYHAQTTPSGLWAILASVGKPPAAPPKPAAETIQPPLIVEARPVPEPLPTQVEPEPVSAPAPREPIPAPSPLREPTPLPEPPSAPAPTPAAPSAPPPAAEPSVTYHKVTVNDSVWNICQRFGISRDQFWEWNGHLWDEHGLPRDGLYMQEGWQVRVA